MALGNLAQRFLVAVVAVPPASVASELLRLQQLNLARTYTDVASAKAEPQREAETMDTLRPGEDMVGLAQAFEFAEEEYRPGEKKK